MTELGIPYGTATYAAPEQAKGEKTDHRADIFSSGVLLYEMLTGIWAFQGKTVIDVRHQVLHGTPKPLANMRNESLPPQLQQIIDKALAKDPKDRYQKIKTMRDELKQVLQMVSGNNALQGDTFSPSHLEGSVVKRAWNWLTGKSSADESTQQNAFGFQSADIFARYDFDRHRTGKEIGFNSAVQKSKSRPDCRFLRILRLPMPSLLN